MMAVPASPKPMLVQQADGTYITVYQHGDEYFHYTTDDKGQWITRNADGMYIPTEALSEEEITFRRQQKIQEMPDIRRTCGWDLNLAPRGLCILVNFSNKEFITDINELDSMFNGQNYTREFRFAGSKVKSSGSARQYFIDQSDSLYQPYFDVVGPVTLSKSYSYYGGGQDAHAPEMILEACQIADNDYDVDFTQYDADHDGNIDFVYVLYAGFGQADSPEENTVWPHSADLSPWNRYFDGKRLSTYACSNEIKYDYAVPSNDSTHNGIGTITHEFSHVLGLPDLYCTGSSKHKTMGDWDIMDSGPYNNEGNTPPGYSGYERWFMGWRTPRLVYSDEAFTLTDMSKGNEYLYVTASGEPVNNILNPDPQEFYILENRQRASNWDKFLPGSGLMITKITYSRTWWGDNTVNNRANNMGVDIIEADGYAPESGKEGYSGKMSDLFGNGVKEFDMFDTYYLLNIKNWSSGNVKFNFTTDPTGIEDVIANTPEVIAVYDITGRKMSSNDLRSLSRGVYMIQTTEGTTKVVIP